MSFQQNKYQQILNGLKEKIRQARYKAENAINFVIAFSELLYPRQIKLPFFTVLE